LPLNIRNPLAGKLAKELASRRNITLTEAIISALQEELRRDNERKPLETRLRDVVARHTKGRVATGRDLTKPEITELWEN
jgi:antitoxin VapB